MQRIVNWIAPKGPLDFGLKLWFWLFLIGVTNFLRDVLEHPQTHDTLWTNIVEASFVGLPFSVFALALVGHMQKLQDQLATLATTDVLTGLPNRRVFLKQLDSLLGRHDAVLLMIDVDHFKRVNDTYGHAVGDHCLQAIAEHLMALRGPDDMVARLGGEEFGMLVARGQAAQFTDLGAQIAAGVTLEVDPNAQPITITNSIGAIGLGDVSITTEAMRQADIALYAAKAAGRARMLQAEQAALPINDAATQAMR